jgi:hypothetical protein
MWRKIGGAVAGFIIAVLLVQGAEAIVHALYPFPPGMNPHDMNDIKKFVSTLPVLALLLVLGGWLIGTFLGTYAAARIGRSAVPGYVLGGLLLCAGIANSIIIPQPVWFSAASFVIYIGMTLVGARLGRPAPA